MSSSKWKKPLKHQEVEEMLQTIADRLPPNHTVRTYHAKNTTELCLQWKTSEGNTVEKTWEINNTQLPSQQQQ